ncbi:hypothetical protein THAOC_02895, partial [Thalassiosira oceanica]
MEVLAAHLPAPREYQIWTPTEEIMDAILGALFRKRVPPESASLTVKPSQPMPVAWCHVNREPGVPNSDELETNSREETDFAEVPTCQPRHCLSKMIEARGGGGRRMLGTTRSKSKRPGSSTQTPGELESKAGREKKTHNERPGPSTNPPGELESEAGREEKAHSDRPG